MPDLASITPQQIEEEIKLNGPGVALQKLAYIAQQSALIQARAEVAQVNARVEQGQRAEQLKDIGRNDPWVFTPEGMNRLFEIRAQKPWLNNAPNPMEAAYDDYLAQESKKQRLAPQFLTPTPKPPTAKAPPTPAGGARQVQVPRVDLNDAKSINAYLDKLTPEQQTAWFKKNLPGAK